MKKKIINGFLMVALIAATSASFVSCKDNDEDMKYDLLNALKGDITTVNTDITKAQNDATKALGDAAAAAAAASKAQGTADEAKSTAQQALDKINALDLSGYMKKDEFNDSVSKYLKDWALESSVAERFSAVWDSIAGLDKAVKAIDAKVNALDGRLTVVEDSVKSLQTQLDGVKTRLTKVEGDITNIVKTLENLITSVTVNATSTSLLANSKVLPGVNAQLLGAAFGILKADVTFPEADGVLAATDINKTVDIKKGYTNSEAGNAGIVYFTVNPSNIDASLVDLSLVNSKGEKKYVELGKITPASKELVWGGLSTRADGDVTLWQAPATIDFENTPEVSLSQVVDFKSIASNVKSLINDAKGVEANKASVKSTGKALLTDAAKLVANLASVNIPQMPALALKAQWKDTVGTRSVISDYSIAATAYKPFAFNALNGVDLGGNVDLTKIDNFFKKIVDNIMKDIDGINLDGLKIGKIEIDDYSAYDKSQNLYIWQKIDLTTEKKTVKDGSGNDQTITYVTAVSVDIKITSTSKAPEGYTSAGNFKVDADMSQAIKDLIGDDTKGVNKTLADANKAIQDIVDQVKNIIKKADDAAAKAKNLEDRATDYLQSYINKSINFISSGRILEPILLVDGKNGIARATGTYEAGTYTFVPTTMNYEILAPAFKKYVAVVKGGTIKESYLENGTNLKSVKLNLTEKGDYTIVYSALDFNGNQISKKYNVTVK